MAVDSPLTSQNRTVISGTRSRPGRVSHESEARAASVMATDPIGTPGRPGAVPAPAGTPTGTTRPVRGILDREAAPAAGRASPGASVGAEAPYRLGTAVVDVERGHFSSNAFLNLAEGGGRAVPAGYRSSGDPGGSTIE